MRLLACNEYQKRELSLLHPERRVADYFALIPAGEYYHWARKYTLLYEDLCGRFSAVRNASKAIGSLPIVQCVAKLCSTNTDGYLNPRVFKFTTLSEGMRDFGFQPQVISRLDVVAPSLPFTLKKFYNKYTKINTSILGFLAWDSTSEFHLGSRYLPSYVNCACKVKDLKITDSGYLVHNETTYHQMLTTSNHYDGDGYKAILSELNDRRMLVLPLNFPLVNLKNLIGFTNPLWAEVSPLEYFLEEPPEIVSNYVLIRTDDGKRRTWNEVMNDAKLRLELEMSEYWLWQQTCPAAPLLQHINMYWTFGQDYPWLVDKRDKKWVPALVVDT